jgi:hypothetical protein
MGRSRGGLTTIIHALVDACGLPIALELTDGQAHDGKSAEAMLSALPRFHAACECANRIKMHIYDTVRLGRIFFRHGITVDPGHHHHPRHRENNRTEEQPEQSKPNHAADNTDHDHGHRCGKSARHQEWP